uniref:Synaptogenesis protein syg-2-like n=1 Tax=Dermatophagoides pteronyssinus TaxID=6956 RepID=A0A6P6YES9_DERPT
MSTTFVYTVLINDKVQLPCDIQPPTMDDQIVLVLWYKDDELAPILTLDVRKIHGRPAHLSIDPVAASDEGDYRCRVDFRKARTINTVISLKVIIPPQVPKITDQDGNYLTGLVGPYNEGDELTLTCLTKGGKPRPSLIWWRDYAIIDDSFEFDDRDVTTNELVIQRLSRHHLLAILMCQAINSNLTSTITTSSSSSSSSTTAISSSSSSSSSSTATATSTIQTSNSITLDLNLKPIEIRITQLTPILVAGNDALFECNTFGSRPMPIIYWLFDGNRYDTRIHDPPQMELKLGAPSLSLDSIQEGIDIYFDCHIDSNPLPTTPITWLFNGEPLQPEP